MSKVPLNFQAEIISHSPMENSGFTSCRARVFYEGLNRNGSFIDKACAEELVRTASGCPVVGLWDSTIGDFTDHSPSDRKRAYGFIPENPNFAWEKGADWDGVERSYAAFDIILWTKAFEEANAIITHPLSMELVPDTICGDYRVVNGEYVFYFSHAELLGVCVLGYDVEPCFEGAKFLPFDEVEEFKKLFKLDKEEALLTYNAKNIKGDTSMENEEEKVVQEEFVQVRDEDIEVTGEEEATPASEPVTEENFGKEEEATEETHEEKPVEESTEEEPQFEKNKEDSEGDNPQEKAKELIEDLEAQNCELKEKIDDLEARVKLLEDENFALNAYKAEKEKEEKQAVVEQYAEVLTSDELKAVNVEDFSKDELNDKLAAMAYRKIANHTTANFQMINTNISADDSDDISSIVKKYKKEN